MLTTIPKNTKYETASRAGEREYRAGKRSLETIKVINVTASQRVQRGMNRPPGKSKKNSMAQATPTISTPWTGNRQAGCEETKASASVVSTAVPNVTRNSDTSSAIRSSERRRKMSAPTAIQTKSATLSTATFRNAYVDNDRPASCSARTPSGVGWPTARSEQTPDAAVHTLRKNSKLLGTLNTIIASAVMATATHATRASRSQCPRRVVGGGEARGLISLIPRSGEDCSWSWPRRQSGTPF